MFYMKTILRKIEFENITPEYIYDVLDKVSQRYEPLIFSIKREYWRKLGLAEDGFKDWFIEGIKKLPVNCECGDMIMSGENNLYFYKFIPEEKSLYAGLISKVEKDGFEQFCGELIKMLQEANLQFSSSWIDVAYSGDIIDSINEQSEVFTPSKQDMEASKYLEDELARKLLSKIKETSGSSISKIVSSAELPKIGPVVDEFEKLGIITKDFVVLCSKTGQPILKVSSRSALDETPQGTNKCFICGNPLSKETIDEIVSCSDFGKNLLERGYWLQVRMLSALKRLGVPMDTVRVWSDDSDIAYMFSIINGQPYLLVLCNNPVTLEDVYHINIYVSAYSVKNLLVISTEKIPLLVKNYIEESNASNTAVSFVESLTAIDDAVEFFVVKRGASYVSELLSSFIDLIPVNIHELVVNMFQGEHSEPAEAAGNGSSDKPEKNDKPRKKASDKKPDNGSQETEKVPVLSAEDEEMMLGEKI